MAIFTIPLHTSRPTLGLRGELDRLFEHAGQPRPVAGWAPAFDVRESSERIVIDVDLPGVSAESVEVLAEDSVLTVKGEKRPRPVAAGEQLVLAERSAGAFVRRFRLPKNADAGNVSAEYVDGVLSIQITKVLPTQPRRVTVQIGRSGAAVTQEDIGQPSA